MERRKWVKSPDTGLRSSYDPVIRRQAVRKIAAESGAIELEAREVERVILHYRGVPVEVTGTVATLPGNWPLIDGAA